MGFFSFIIFVGLLAAILYFGVQGSTTLIEQGKKQIEQNERIIAALERLAPPAAERKWGDTE
jgi:hypothetical protein